jgi:hypothetical protein
MLAKPIVFEVDRVEYGIGVDVGVGPLVCAAVRPTQAASSAAATTRVGCLGLMVFACFSAEYITKLPAKENRSAYVETS